jgi:hypothetical protein
MMPRLVTALFAACCLAGAAAAQNTPPTHIRGTIAAVEGTTVAVSARDGTKVDVTVPEGARISSLEKTSLDAIKPGTFIGTAARPGPNGELQALEVLVFPESARGTGEGHYGWDLTPESTMTNATVTAAVESTSGRELTLSYKGGSVKVMVPPDAPVVTPVPASQSDLRPGAPVFISAVKEESGKLSARFVIVGKNGVAPPM